MKKFSKMLLFVVCLIVLCSACEGDVTRALRHAGYSLSDTKFVCDAFFDEENPITVRFLTADRAITDEGIIYELSPGQKFSNEQNCRIADTGLRVSAIMDDTVFLATNGGIYRLTSSGDSGAAYTEITSADSSYGTYATLFYSGSGIKYTTVDSQNGIYYSLSSDGNVYGYTLYSEDRNSYPEIAGMVIVYNKLDYGDILDYHYAGNSPLTYVRTSDKFYHLTVSNEAECSAYADIQCNYIMTDDEILEKNQEFIYAYNGSSIYTTYGKLFTMGTGGDAK